MLVGNPEILMFEKKKKKQTDTDPSKLGLSQSSRHFIAKLR